MWFMRDEDLRVKVALASQNASQLDRAGWKSMPRPLKSDVFQPRKGLNVACQVLQESRVRSEDLKKGLLSCSEALSESFSQAKELLVEAPKALKADEVLRRELREALEEQEACGGRALEAWHRAERGCEEGVGLVEEQESCLEREEALTVACRRLYASAASGYEAQWQRAEKKLSMGRRLREPTWQMAQQCAVGWQKELKAQEELSRLLEQELRHKVLLDAELMAPAEAKRAIASLRQLTRHEAPQLLSPKRLLA